ncbi:MAG: DNA-binding response regulator [Candidatus Schekmanbacteria bacterium]|nr:MAG: DNA-binding response regulator [Candidatus Schekmanbacteria bacterium]
MKNHILIIEDDVKIVRNLKEYLPADEYSITHASDGQKGIEFFNENPPDLILLDIMLPELDGLEVCREIRKKSMVPIIMITAKGEETDVVVGLELGADDYITKPFSMRELLARIKAAIRRSKEMNEISFHSEVVKYPTFSVNIPKREITKGKKKIQLTVTEYNLLSLFMKNPGKVFTRNSLIDFEKGKDNSPYDRSIDSHISHLRQKIEDDPKHPKYIKTVWGVGYKFDPDDV